MFLQYNTLQYNTVCSLHCSSALLVGRGQDVQTEERLAQWSDHVQRPCVCQDTLQSLTAPQHSAVCCSNTPLQLFLFLATLTAAAASVAVSSRDGRVGEAERAGSGLQVLSHAAVAGGVGGRAMCHRLVPDQHRALTEQTEYIAHKTETYQHTHKSAHSM